MRSAGNGGRTRGRCKRSGQENALGMSGAKTGMESENRIEFLNHSLAQRDQVFISR